MSIRNDGIRLNMLTKELILKWQDTKYYWRDAESEEFERTYIAELQTSVDTSGGGDRTTGQAARENQERL